MAGAAEAQLWVNLKPNEPDTIMDPQLARTRVGRIMLEADLELKRQSARLLDPDARVGGRFWRAIGWDCVLGTRLWITPGIAKVRAGGDQLYILDAPLRVNLEGWDYVPQAGDPQAPQGLAGCPDQSPAQRTRTLAAQERIVLPRLTRIVNRAPEFAPLRRVYLSRVAAEWYRQRSQDQDTAFAGIIDSGEIERWTRSDSWRPEQTFRSYVRSFTHGDYHYTRTWTEGGAPRPGARRSAAWTSAACPGSRWATGRSTPAGLA